jgi:hypothetical protein
MNKEEAIEQLYRLSLDWEENGLDTKLNQTDINAIKTIVSELDIANKKLDKIKECIEKIWLADKDSGEILIDLENILYDNMYKINKEE